MATRFSDALSLEAAVVAVAPPGSSLLELLL